MTKFLCALIVGAALLVGSGCSDFCGKPTTAPTPAPAVKDKPKADNKCECTKCTCKKCPGNCNDKDCDCKGCKPKTKDK